MPCGRKPLRRMWDKPNKNLKTVKPSRYEQNEPCVKLHWKNVIKELEMSYADEQFWESNYQTVRELVDPVTYERIAKIFSLPQGDPKYQPKDVDDEVSITPSEMYYNAPSQSQKALHPTYSITSYESSLEEEQEEEEWEEQSIWSTMTSTETIEAIQKSHSKGPSKSSMAKAFSRTLNKSVSKLLSKSTTRSMSSKFASKTKSMDLCSDAEESAKSDDDMVVHPSSARGTKHHKREIINNPHFDMLYCNDSETDMIKWNSKYKQKTFEVSASDEFSKKAEITTKKLVKAFSPQYVKSAYYGYFQSLLTYGIDMWGQAADRQRIFTLQKRAIRIMNKVPWDEPAQNLFINDKILTVPSLCILEVAKLIAHEFYEWWVSLGSVEFISEIKRPKDIEELFQVWFDEHASRGLVIDPKIMPCVLESIANYIGVPKASCPNALERQIAWDIHAETSPAHNMAFGTCLPLKMKHIPPQNNTEHTWRSLKIPEDLRTMETVWGDISHLTSTKSFQKWLEPHKNMPMPACLKDLDAPKQQLFVVPSDYVVRERSMEGFSEPDLAFPVSQFSIEIKEVLSRLLND